MIQEKSPEITEFHRLITAIREESAELKKVILTKEEEAEGNKIFVEFDEAIQNQVFSTLNYLIKYQLKGWRELVDGGDDSDDGSTPTERGK